MHCIAVEMISPKKRSGYSDSVGDPRATKADFIVETRLD